CASATWRLRATPSRSTSGTTCARWRRSASASAGATSRCGRSPGGARRPRPSPPDRPAPLRAAPRARRDGGPAACRAPSSGQAPPPPADSPGVEPWVVTGAAVTVALLLAVRLLDRERRLRAALERAALIDPLTGLLAEAG